MYKLFVEYSDLDSLMDNVNAALDDLENQSDALYEEARKMVEESKHANSDECSEKDTNEATDADDSKGT